MYNWKVKFSLKVEDADGIVEPNMIKYSYVIGADTFSHALMEAYNDIINSEYTDGSYDMTVINVTVKRLGRTNI